ncbi:MAG TPA: hypothetical protein VG055_27240 [Planctomycetaceae bacterium]|jgi:hypothetical protein|nr:hypothetical protein [Planctomycetaceae bacterium]
MKVLACLFIGIAFGTALGGRQALDRARHHDFVGAAKMLRASPLVNLAASLMACYFILSWPYRRIDSTTAEEVSETVLRPVEELVPKRFLGIPWGTTTQTHVEPTVVTKTVTRETNNLVLDPWLVPVTAVLACVSCGIELAAIRFIWWARG